MHFNDLLRHQSRGRRALEKISKFAQTRVPGLNPNAIILLVAAENYFRFNNPRLSFSSRTDSPLAKRTFLRIFDELRRTITSPLLLYKLLCTFVRARHLVVVVVVEYTRVSPAKSYYPSLCSRIDLPYLNYHVAVRITKGRKLAI